MTKFSKKVKYKQMEENISQPEKEFSPSPSQTIPNPKPKFSLILTGILLLALGGVGGFLLGRQSLQPKSTTTTAQVTPLPSKAPGEERITETPSATPTLDPTAEWKTYENRDLSFKYPSAQTIEPYRIIGVDPNFIIYIASEDSPLMNECMKLDEIEKKNNLVIKKFSRVTTGEMCSTNDSNPREIWVVPTEEDYSPGISYTYSAKDNPEAEEIFDLILSTFKFLD